VRSGRSAELRAGGSRAYDADRAFLGAAALLFAASAAVTVLQCTSMAALGGMGMAGGWIMSMAWMRMPGHGWLATFGCFLAMWLAMMVAMMLPSLTPLLRRHWRRVGRLDLTLRVGIGYFAVSTALGAAIFPLGAALAAAQMRWPLLARAAPGAAGVVVVAAGLVQFTHWKTRQLACCRNVIADDATPDTDGVAAWRLGLRLGLRCCCCCVPHMAVLLVIGVMDVRAMAVVSGAIAAERLLAGGARIARVAGAVAVGVGTLVVAHAAGMG
jgi:predicted metal-binding membrane protein